MTLRCSRRNFFSCRKCPGSSMMRFFYLTTQCLAPPTGATTQEKTLHFRKTYAAKWFSQSATCMTKLKSWAATIQQRESHSCLQKTNCLWWSALKFPKHLSACWSMTTETRTSIRSSRSIEILIIQLTLRKPTVLCSSTQSMSLLNRQRASVPGKSTTRKPTRCMSTKSLK